MTKILVDTDIVIDYLKTEKGVLPDLLKLQAQDKAELYMSTIAVLEIFAGKPSKKQTSYLHQLFSGFKVIYVTAELSQFAGELKRDNNLSISFADLLVGASALYIRAKLATRNRKHFQGIPKLNFYGKPTSGVG